MKRIKMKIEVKTYEFAMADSGAPSISSPNQVFECLKGDFNVLQEEMYVLFLNHRNQLINKVRVALGVQGMLVITPKEIFRPALLEGASHIVVAHNHPSGVLDPSKEDLEFTKKLVKAGEIVSIQVLDHIIFTDEGCYSLREKHGGMF